MHSTVGDKRLGYRVEERISVGSVLEGQPLTCRPAYPPVVTGTEDSVVELLPNCP